MITDTLGTQMALLNFLEPTNTDTPVTVIKVDCHAGYSLKADPAPEATVLARLHGVGSYVDIETSPIDLTPYDGTNQSFDLKIHTGASPANIALNIKVSNS